MRTISKAIQKQFRMRTYFEEANEVTNLKREFGVVLCFSFSQRSLGRIIERLVRAGINYKEFDVIYSKLMEFNHKLVEKFKECLK